ncbi:MAG: TadE family protein [Bdellovibrionota bacterium]
MRSTDGVSMVEFAIVSGLVFFLLFALIDVCRYALTQNLLTYAARQIADSAKVNPVIGKDVRFAAGTPQAQRFNDVRQQIINDVIGLGNLPYGARLLSYKMRDEFNPDPTNPLSSPGSALLLMPGESALREEDAKITRILHPTCVNCQPYITNSVSSFEELRSKHGIYTQVSAKLPLLVAGNKEITVVGEAIEWQEPDAGFHIGIKPDTAEKTLLCRTLNQEEECEKAACDPTTETCTFNPGRYSPDCATCTPITCGAYWTRHEAETGESFCNAAGCRDLRSCLFFADKSLDPANGDPVSTCGNCGLGKLCKQLYTEDGLCHDLNCSIGYSCRWYPNRKISRNTVCAECISKSCRLRTDQATACAPLNCEAQGKDCYFKWWEKGSTCAECVDRVCAPEGGACPRGTVWSGKPKCTCCRYSNCSHLNVPRKNIKYVFDARECRCVRQPDDSTGDMQ